MLTDWIIIAAIVIGPIAAVQVQKKIESLKDRRARQLHIFRVLMSTRATRLSPDHVAALNMIDTDFSEKIKKEKPVINAWHVLLDQFVKYPDSENFPDQTIYLSVLNTAINKAEDYFVELLLAMSNVLDYDFDSIHIRNGCYAPTGHAEIENDNRLLRKGVIALLEGNIPLKMDVQSLPEQEPHENVVDFLRITAERQQESLDIMKKIIEGKASLSVSVASKTDIDK